MVNTHLPVPTVPANAPSPTTVPAPPPPAAPAATPPGTVVLAAPRAGAGATPATGRAGAEAGAAAAGRAGAAAGVRAPGAAGAGAGVMTQEAAPTACIARECLRHLRIPGILRFFPPTWPSIAIIPNTDVVAAPGPPSPVWSKAPVCPVQPLRYPAERWISPSSQARAGRRVGALQRVCHDGPAPSSPMSPSPLRYCSPKHYQLVQREEFSSLLFCQTRNQQINFCWRERSS